MIDISKIAIAFIAVIFLMHKTVTAQQVSKPLVQLGLKDFLKELYDVSTLPSFATYSYVAEISTYDRTGGNNDVFNGTYSFVRGNADSSMVLFDVKGAGVINRKNGHILVYSICLQHPNDWNAINSINPVTKSILNQSGSHCNRPKCFGKAGI